MNSRWNSILADPEARETFADGHMVSYLTAQLVAIREARGLTQQQLAKALKTTQSAIARMESQDYGKWSVQKLKKHAYELGFRLKLSLETFASIKEELKEMDRASLARQSSLAPANSEIQSLVVPEQTLWMRRKLLPWLDERNRELGQLKLWLSGDGLPPVEDRDLPHVVLIDAIPLDEHGESEYQWKFLDDCEKLLPEIEDELKAHAKMPPWAASLFRILAEWPNRERFGHSFFSLYQVLQDLASNHRLSLGARGAFTAAYAHHQTTDAAIIEWYEMQINKTTQVLLGNYHDALAGLDHVPDKLQSQAQARKMRGQEQLIDAKLMEEASRAQLLSDIYHLRFDGRSAPYLKSVEYGLTNLALSDTTVIQAVSMIPFEKMLRESQLNILDRETSSLMRNNYVAFLGQSAECADNPAEKARFQQQHRQLRQLAAT